MILLATWQQDTILRWICLCILWRIVFHSVSLFFAAVFTCSNKSKIWRTMNLKATFCGAYTYHDATVVAVPMKVNVHIRYLSNNSIPRYLASVGNRRRSQSRKKSDAQSPLLKIPCNTVTLVLFLFPKILYWMKQQSEEVTFDSGDQWHWRLYLL